jgi:hypothetical protein
MQSADAQSIGGVDVSRAQGGIPHAARATAMSNIAAFFPRLAPN